MSNSISILIPYKNEKKNIKLTTKNLIYALNYNNIKNYKIFLIDDGSTDGSFHYLKNFKNKNIIKLRNKYSIGFKKNFEKIIKNINTKYFALYCGNNHFKKRDYINLLSPLKNDVDIIIHYIPNTLKKRGIIKYFISNMIIFFMNIKFSKKLKFYTGQNIYKTKLIKKFRANFNFSVFFIEILLFSLKKANKIKIVNTNFYPRTFGKTKSLNFKNVVEVLKLLCH